MSQPSQPQSSQPEQPSGGTLSAPASCTPRTPRTPRTGIIMAVYLLGLLVGGLYVGMVSPARTVIQQDLGLSDALGIWMVNIYTLFYAASIPVTGKLADRYGRRRVFTVCMAVFGVGSVLCGLAQSVGGLPLLLAGRVVQAVGAGGVIPVATAEIGVAVPPERRGMALGMAAGVAGLSNMLGAACGSLVIDLVGAANWSLLFYVSVPFCVAIVAASMAWLPNSEVQATGRLDVMGSCLFAAAVLALLLGINGVDLFDPASLAAPQAWVPLAAALVLGAVFVLVERRAEDPVLNLGYFSDRSILITLAVSFFVGCCIISTTLIPQFAEEAFGLPAGKGGYYIMIFGVFAIAGPPMGGKLIDRFGAKPVLLTGLAVAGVGFAFLAFVTAAWPSFATMFAGLAIVGLGLGFAMGTPLNYMMLENTDPAQSSSAIATLSLVRQLGTSIAPAVLVGFLAQGLGMDGWRWVFGCIVACSAIGVLLMLRYREERPSGGKR